MAGLGHNRDVPLRVLAVIAIAIVVVFGRADGVAPRAAGWKPRLRTDADIPAVAVSRQLRDAQGLSVGEIISLSTDPSGAGARAVPSGRRLRADARSDAAGRDASRGKTAPAGSDRDVGGAIDPTRVAADPLDLETVDAINVLVARSVQGTGARPRAERDAARRRRPSRWAATTSARRHSSCSSDFTSRLRS